MPTQLVVLAWAVPIAMLAIAAVIDAIVRARRLGRQRTLADLAALSWVQFEEVIGDAFRRHGYRVRQTGGRGADGGVDLVLIRDGETTVVQAKHWRRDLVGVALVRELYGVQQSVGGDRAMFVSLGGYSPAALEFATQVGMTLIDGEELLRIITAGLDGKALVLPTPTGITAPACPACGGAMVRQTARRGPHAGQDFWGCASFPRCRGTVAIAAQIISGR